jgi:hypothetical protein
LALEGFQPVLVGILLLRLELLLLLVEAAVVAEEIATLAEGLEEQQPLEI